MRHYVLIALLASLSACKDMGGPGPVDAKKFLSSLDGPKVPTMQDTLLESARAAEAQGNYNQAMVMYSQAAAKYPNNKEVSIMFADSIRRSGEYDRAIVFYDDLLTKDPSLLSAKEGKALAMMAKGDFETPVTLFQEIMAVDATRWKTLNGLGILFTTRGMTADAQKYYDEALKHSPANAAILNNMGLSMALDRKFDQAIDQLKQSVSATTVGGAQRRQVELNLALVYGAAGRLDEARMIAENYFTGPALNNNLGLYAHLSKDDQMAKAYLNMALTESKTFYQKAWDNLQQLGNKGTPVNNTSVIVRTGDTYEAAPFIAATEEPVKTKSKKKSKR
ncbi:MAG: tetratricopeptide repeat protein [Rickettsiales bacterium]|nr:tetratricopeptide repeat protein [Rickettsiales bacterium]